MYDSQTSRDVRNLAFYLCEVEHKSLPQPVTGTVMTRLTYNLKTREMGVTPCSPSRIRPGSRLESEKV